MSCLGSTIAKTLKKFNVDLTLNRQTENMSRNMNMIAQNIVLLQHDLKEYIIHSSFPSPNASFVVVIVVVVERPRASLDRDEGLTINGQRRQ